MPKRMAPFVSALALLFLAGFGLILADEKKDTPVSPDTLMQGEMCGTLGFCAPKKATSTQTEKKVETNATVIRTVDGDTFEVRIDGQPGEAKVRMLGIDTPETVDPRRAVGCFGKEASKKLADLLSGKRVRLEEDTAADEHDRYGRLLRNAFLEDGTDVNALMVQEGYAYAYLQYPLDRARKSELKTLQELAKAAGAGLWSNTACPVSS